MPKSLSFSIAIAAEIFLASCATAPQPVDLIVSDITVYSGEDEAPFIASVAVKNGTFVAVDRKPRRYKAVTVLKGEGLYMTPGLWDMHAHIANGEKQNIEVSEFVKYGVTTIRDVGGFTDAILARRAAIDSGASQGPTVFYVGPTLNGEAFAPFHRAATTKEAVRRAVDEAAASGAAMIKIHRAFKPELLPVVIAAAHERNIRLTGHIPLGVSPLEACEAGMDGIEHIGSLLEALVSVAPKEKATVGDAVAYMDSEEAAPIYDCFARRDVNITPTLVVYPAVARSRLGDAPTPPDYLAFLNANKRIILRLYQSGATILAGTDTAQNDVLKIAPGASLLDELEMLQDAGLPPKAVIAAATTNPARALDVEATRGSIAVGKIADFLLLDADPGADIANFRKLHAVYQAGVKVEGR